MITGYNTDVSHQGRVLHVQTEDKGRATAWIESLVYAGGQILARKRSSYKGLLDRGEGRPEISELMDRQHRMVIAEVRRGRFDAKLAELGPQPEGAPAVSAVVAEAAALAAPAPGDEPPEAGPSLDQVILDYLNSEAEQEQLVLSMDLDDELRLGETARLLLSARSSVSSAPLAAVEVAVRMISSVEGPVTLGVGKTADDGTLRLTVNVPALQQGTAALIVSATSDIGGAEIKQLL